MSAESVARRPPPQPTNIVSLLKPRRFGDARGWFCETFSEAAAAAAGITTRFVQDNQSYSSLAGTIRGLHFQRPPHAQAKLVRCLRGSVMDYAVDVRRGSPTYGRFIATKLTAAGGEQLFIPEGFAHGFLTLEPDVEVAYKVSDIYAPHCDGGIAWNDPDIGIDWPLPPGTEAILSDKDQALPTLRAFDSPFAYDGQPLQPL
ncbi:dTDP-4-dehydrorhamnose 3,5-epimerase [Ancylobacter defluvii]|uniref:dTDP-4-dehydrorhamnose 3,5-epimerase n=1 Tax=Ancylobacter defluvii TaxID=1282440 RepID=A0A9W6JUG5_9HYPH|nr:dTDP-4-dehydrorhamnose 3,5-epimerase [Ancylobacter defluvii]MBS7588690.1 dTDP-4-dehydrorhamnose 3,5-epimerase [Ancylobacter defluvii]GLK83971.1 dTDP-4-dehydrorhamnose 3,5-epimerase [Ancylobacter defluvii]